MEGKSKNPVMETAKKELEEVVTIDVATEEVNKWLDHKRVKPNRRKDLKQFVDILIDAVCYGQLSLDSNFKWKLKLEFPEALNGAVTEIEFLPRINDTALDTYKRGVEEKNAFDRSNLIMLCGLTRQPVNFIKALYTEDKQVADAIAIFFL